MLLRWLDPCLRIFASSIFACFLFRWLRYHANDKRHQREKTRNTSRKKKSPIASFFRASQPMWKQEWRSVMTEKKNLHQISKQMKIHHDCDGSI